MPEAQSFILSLFAQLIAENLPPVATSFTAGRPENSKRDNFFYNFGISSSPASLRQRDRNLIGAESLMLQYYSDERQDVSMLKNYSVIEQIFVKYDTVPSSSAQVERLFSNTSIIDAPKSNLLCDTKLEQRVMLRFMSGSLGS